MIPVCQILAGENSNNNDEKQCSKSVNTETNKRLCFLLTFVEATYYVCNLPYMTVYTAR